MLSDRAAKAAFLLAGLCPFLANYAAAALTETLEIFCREPQGGRRLFGFAGIAVSERSATSF